MLGNLGRSFPLQKEHFVFDVFDVTSFDLSLLFPFSLPMRLLLSLPLRLPFSLHTLLRASCLCGLVVLSLTNLHHSESCGLCTSIAALIVSKILHLVPLYRTFPLLQGLTSASHERTLQQLHQHRSISTYVHQLPHIQKSSPDLESIHWIAHSSDHLDCLIFRVHHQHERKLLHSFLLNIAHSKKGQFSQ